MKIKDISYSVIVLLVFCIIQPSVRAFPVAADPGAPS